VVFFRRSTNTGRIGRTVGRILDEMEGNQDQIRFIQEWAGYLLTADTTQQKSVMAAKVQAASIHRAFGD